MSDRDDFLGIGWAFPVDVNRADAAPTAGGTAQLAGSLRLAVGVDAIRESIQIILGTARGERLMRPTFGSGLHELVFAPNDATTAALVAFEVREALIDWEPRIDVVDVRVTRDADEGNKLLIDLRYRVRSTNNVFNLVYPFYLQGTGG